MHGRRSLAQPTIPLRSIPDLFGPLQRGGAAADLSARKACACEWPTSASTERSRAAHSSTAWRVGTCPSSRTASSCACSETRPRCAEPTVSAMPSTARRAASASRVIAASCADRHGGDQRLSGGERGGQLSHMLQSHASGKGAARYLLLHALGQRRERVTCDVPRGVEPRRRLDGLLLRKHLRTRGRAGEGFRPSST